MYLPVLEGQRGKEVCSNSLCSAGRSGTSQQWQGSFFKLFQMLIKKLQGGHCNPEFTVVIAAALLAVITDILHNDI